MSTQTRQWDNGKLVFKERSNAMAEPQPAPAVDPVASWATLETATLENMGDGSDTIATCKDIVDIAGEAISYVRRDLREGLAKRDEKIRELEMEIARLRGSVDVLQRGGRAMRVRGTYTASTEYREFDVVALNGSSFIALEDRPGPCPGENWQLLASAGRRGPDGRQGEPGERGPRGIDGPQGERGERGEPAPAAVGIKMLHVDPADYTLAIILESGSVRSVDLRPIFKKFVDDVAGHKP
jgi:hypothetical protein